MKIPTFEEATQALIEKRGTPLDKFVAYWEPEGKEEEKFREMLEDLLEYIRWKQHQPEMMVSQNHGTQEALIRSFWNPSTNQYEEKR